MLLTIDTARKAARRAALVYVSDAEPGFRRRRSGTGFTYLRPSGSVVADSKSLRRIKELAVPPAWTDVWISPDAEGHIQATGRDQRGRKQYRYHSRWSECRDEVKYSSLADFARLLPKLRRKMDADLRIKGLPRERVIASIVWLLDNSMIRVGNAVYARDNKSFGLTTLKSRHVEVVGAKLRFAFKGKSGKEWKLQLVDRRIARTVRAIQDLPGQHLFQYIAEDGARRIVTSQDVNEYIRDATGGEFSSKHFRTWGGTVRALSLFSEIPLPETKTATARAMNIIVDEVAKHLGNRRAVCRRCYIHPLVIASWQEGKLTKELEKALRFKRKKPGLDAEEALVLRWLEMKMA
ncbi:DNA topoisomerase IB [Mesorhizobium sp. VNQ89]|uniref:DNA topoisomerase IB n=1 Tax=Mesorhizobium quangtriensis TaxID=3157709 RepID=UPI0032B87CED